MEREKLIEVLKKRTVANGCTLEEENEAKKKLAKLLEEKKSNGTTFKAGYGNATTFGEYASQVEKEDLFKDFDDLFKEEPPKSRTYKVCPHCGNDYFYTNKYESKHYCHVICEHCMREFFYNGISGVGLSKVGDRPVSFKRFKQFGLNLGALKTQNPTGFVLAKLNSSWWQKLCFDIKEFFNIL